MFIRRRRWNSLKLLLWFLFQHPRDLSSMDHPRVGSFQQAVGFASAGPIAAVRRLAYEAADAGLLSPELAAGISRVKGVKQLGHRSGNWLSLDQSSAGYLPKRGVVRGKELLQKSGPGPYRPTRSAKNLRKAV